MRLNFRVLAAGLWACATLAAQAQAASPPPPEPRFHHVHMNVVAPDRSARYFADVFPTTRVTQWGGVAALQAEDAFILFTKVPRPAIFAWDTALWHIGWNSPDVAADHERIAATGVRFFRTPPPSAHMVSPDNLDVEISLKSPISGGATPTAFNHVHLMSEAPLCAADWYVSVLGLRRGVETGRDGPDCRVPLTPRRDPGNQIHSPSARLYAGDVMIIIFPNQALEPFSPTPAARPSPLVSTKGRLLDHIAFTAPDLDAEERRLRANGVKIVRRPRPIAGSMQRAMMIEGPDSIRIELIESARRQ